MFCFCFFFILTDVRQLFGVGRTTAADDQSDISLSVARRTLPSNPFSLVLSREMIRWTQAARGAARRANVGSSALQRVPLTDALLQLFATHYRELSLIVTLLLCLSLYAEDIPLLPDFLSSLFSVAHCLAPAPLKLRPYGAIQIRLLLLLLLLLLGLLLNRR